MDKETLSNYGWIVICVLVLAVMIALAGPFGTFVAGAVKSTTAGLFGVNQNALGAAGIDIEDQVFENCEHLETEIRNTTADYSGDTCCRACGKILGTGTYTIPTGGKYTKADGTVLNAGQPFPEELTMGDKYRYGDYEYGYNLYYDYPYKWFEGENQNGWGVLYVNKSKATPDPILESICGKPIVSLSYTFAYCTNVTVAPQVPATVTNMYHTFQGCKALVSAPVIPNGVTNLYCAFESCESLKVAPLIPNGAEIINNIFALCSSLESYVGSTDANGDFSNYIIPASVTSTNSIFFYCTSMVKAPIIPSSVTDMTQTFYGCTSLTGTITINTTPSKYTYCFMSVDMSKLTLAGSCDASIKQAIAKTGQNGGKVTIID